ncbi:MAG: ArsR/SmtB family transcription factor [Kiritimatiellia bacterium]
MGKLHPTLWRTCRILAGKTRLELLRSVAQTPDQTVTGLAAQLRISVPRTSQELRRLQSRGLIQANRTGIHVFYRPAPDRLVPTAEPLLRAMQDVFRLFPPSEDESAIRIATALSHPRRISILRLLLVGPTSSWVLQETSGMSRDALNRHLAILRDAGLVRRDGKKILVVDNPHPLAQSLIGILKENQPPPA